MFKNLKIRNKLLVFQLLGSVPAGVLILLVAYLGARAAITEIRMEQLTAVRSSKASEIESYFRQIRGQVATLSESTMVVAAMMEFNDAVQASGQAAPAKVKRARLLTFYESQFLPKMKDHGRIDLTADALAPTTAAGIHLQTAYLSGNPFPLGEKDKLTQAEDGSNYNRVHGRYHPILRNFLREFGYYDIFLIGMDGTIVYSVFKEIDFATNLLKGPHARSNLGAAFRAVQASDSAGAVRLQDYATYTPSYDAAVSFIASPIFSGREQVGVLAFQMPVDKINRIMTGDRSWAEHGLGQTGETYLVGPDHRMRSVSRFLLENPEGYSSLLEKRGVSASVRKKIKHFGTSILLQNVKTTGTVAALAGDASTGIIEDYRGVDVLSSHAPLKVKDVHWVVMSEIDVEEVFRPLTNFSRLFFGIVSVAVLFMLVLSLLLAKRLVRPIEVLDRAVHRFGEDGEEVVVPVTRRDELGRLTKGFNGMVQSIQEQSAHLRENEARTRAIVDSALDAIITIDERGLIDTFNPAAEALFGYRAEEVLRENVSLLMPSPHREAHDGYLEHYRETGEKRIIGAGREVQGINRAGELIDLDLSVSETILPGGDRLYTGLLRDIRERKRTEEELRRYREDLERLVDERTAELGKLSQAVEQSPSSVLITSIDGNIEYVNPKVMELSGYSEEELLGQNPRIFRSDEHPPEFYESLWQTILAGNIFHGDVCNRRRNGERYWVSVAIAAARGKDGQITHFIAVQEDITERRARDEELRQAKEEAEHANRAKSTFLANMSHELRTPMNAIIGYSEMLAEDAEDDGNDAIIPDLLKIHTSGKHLLALINDILDLSKIEAGRMELYLESFDLATMLRESLGTIEPLVAKNSNELVTEFADDLGTVRVDLTKIRQALFNLVSNAAKFSKDGTIRITARRVQSSGADMVHLDVIDSGIGIPEDKLERVFEEFGQADDSTTKEYGGTGLGLPISRRFCRMMGGDLTVTSKPGVGSTFSIVVPANADAGEVAPSQATTAEAVGDAAIAMSNHPVLVIDDDPDARELLSRLLTSEGYAVLEAKDGAEGLALAKKQQPCVITLDVQMPGMDGWSVLKELKADPDLRPIPVVMVSIVGDQNTGFALGAVESFSKPVDREALLDVLARHTNLADVGTALVIEDDEANRSLLVRSLQNADWRVMEAENGAEGLKRIDEVKPDLILLDLMMPVMDGFDFLLELRSRDDCREIPIIVVTAKDLTDEDRFRLTGGVEKIIQKGAFSRSKFLKDVSDLVKKHDMQIVTRGTVGKTEA